MHFNATIIDFEKHRLARCDYQLAADRAECIRRRNEGTTSGSVERIHSNITPIDCPISRLATVAAAATNRCLRTSGSGATLRSRATR